MQECLPGKKKEKACRQAESLSVLLFLPADDLPDSGNHTTLTLFLLFRFGLGIKGIDTIEMKECPEQILKHREHLSVFALAGSVILPEDSSALSAGIKISLLLIGHKAVHRAVILFAQNLIFRIFRPGSLQINRLFLSLFENGRFCGCGEHPVIFAYITLQRYDFVRHVFFFLLNQIQQINGLPALMARCPVSA